MANQIERLEGVQSEYEEPYLGIRQDGSVLETAGELLLGTALLPAALIYQSFRDGSYFWFWWVLVQGGLGLLLLVVGQFLEQGLEGPGRPALERWILFDETTP